MDIKPRPNHKQYIEALRRLTPEQRLMKAFELNELARTLFLQGLHKRFPDLSEEEIHQIYVKRLDKCHNRNY
jgi:hypothetical protein